jgi:hypothetical protein
MSSSVAFQIIVPLPEPPPVDPRRLLEMRAQTQAIITGIDRALSTARIRRIERRSGDQRSPPGTPVEHRRGKIIGVR